MAQNNHVTFKLMNGKTRGAWQLGIKGMMAKKDGYLKKVQYVPGSDSIFAEDHKGDEKPISPWFEDGFLKVHKDNKVLLQIIYQHSGYNKDFEKVDADREADKALRRMELQELALAKVNVAEEMELRANAVVLVGHSALTMSEKVTRMTVKRMAFDQPQKLLDAMNAVDYRGKYIAALSVLREVVLINPSRTAVTWKDGKTIVNVAAGQDPITKLGVFLSGDDEQAVVTLQTLGEEIKNSYRFKKDITGEEEIQEIIEGKKEEIAPNELDLPEAPFAEYADKTKQEVALTPEETIEELRMNYKATYDKEVPHNKKNDAPWMKKKIAEYN